MLEVVDAVERIWRRLLDDLVLHLVDGLVDKFEDWERGVDQCIHHQVGEEGRLAFGQGRALLYAGLQFGEGRRRFLMDSDQVVRSDEKMMLKEAHVVALPIGLKDDDEVVLGILINLGTLVLLLDILDRERVSLEGFLEQFVVFGVGFLDVQPEPFGVRGCETLLDRGYIGRLGLTACRQQRSHSRSC